jgi:type I restriction enzyme, S subunit
MFAGGMEIRRVKLKEVCDRITVGHVGPMVDKYSEQGVPFLRSQNIAPFRLVLDDLKYIPQGFHERLRKSCLRPGDVAVVRTGYPGTACVIPRTFSELNCADLVVITPSKELNPYYLAAIFNSAWGVASVAGNLVGVAQQHFNIGAARELEVPLPPRSAQDKVAEVLGAYEELIENNQRRIQILEGMARVLYREWFVEFRFPGHAKVPGVASRLGVVPKGWEVKPLSAIADVNRAQINARNPPDEVHYIDIASVSPGQINAVTTYPFSEAPGRARRIVEHGDVLWSCVRPNRRSHALVTFPQPDTIASTGFAVLTAKEVPYMFLYAATTTDEFVSYLTNSASGAAYPAVTASTFQQAELIIPPPDLLKRYGEVTVPMAEQAHFLRLQSRNLRKTRDLLLPRLLRSPQKAHA